MTKPQEPDPTPVEFEKMDSGIGVITMNRPEKLNAINMGMIEAFERLFEDLDRSKDTRVVILTGNGRGFCAGADLAEALSRSSDEDFSTPELFLSRVQERYANLVAGLRRIPQPVIAAVNGPAAGGGLAMAIGADIRIAVPEAYFVASFINIGLSGGEMGTSYLLPRLVGLAHASEILFTGRKVHADEAKEMGLVSRLVQREALLDEAKSIADTLLAKSPGGLALTKRVLDGNLSAPSLESALELENRNQTILALSSRLFQ